MSGASQSTPPIVTLLAFDFGERRIGVAVGQTVTSTATPLETVAMTGREPDWRRISQLVESWDPQALVVGLPLNMDGSEQPITRRARRFGEQLRRRFARRVDLIDERLSTREARRRLGNASLVEDDPVSAQVILETWLGEAAPSPTP